MTSAALRLLVAIGLASLLSAGVRAQSAAEFHKGRQLQMVVGFEVGNDYDVGARLLARYLSKQLPGQPATVVQNMPQAAALLAANFIYGRSPRDGSLICSSSRR